MAARNRAYTTVLGFYEPLLGSMMGQPRVKLAARERQFKKICIPIYFIRYATLLYATLARTSERISFEI